jgi:uncharacterized RDD family membrane protein YckC
MLDQVTGLPLAPWWKRLLAYLIDSCVVAGITYACWIPALVFLSVGSAAQPGQPLPASFWAVQGTFIALALLIPGLYFGIMDGCFRGQTLGKMALGIALRDCRENRLTGFWRALARYLVNFLLEIPFSIPFLIGNLAPLWDARRQSWADHAVGSIVVEVRR